MAVSGHIELEVHAFYVDHDGTRHQSNGSEVSSPVDLCPVCSALVVDVDAHERWHNRINQAMTL